MTEREWLNRITERGIGAAPGVGTPMRGGITFHEAHLAMEKVADSRKIIAFELVEMNPIIDLTNKTAILGVGLAASALGKKIL